jgi:hypothetical protein
MTVVSSINFGLNVISMSSLHFFFGLIIFGALGFTAVLGHGALDYWWDPYPPFQPWIAIS